MKTMKGINLKPNREYTFAVEQECIYEGNTLVNIIYHPLNGRGEHCKLGEVEEFRRVKPNTGIGGMTGAQILAYAEEVTL